MIRFIALSILFFGATPGPAVWTNQFTWQRIRRGMTQDQVLRVFGEPAEKKYENDSLFWIYKTEKITGQVVFVANESKQYEVTSKIEPDWSKLKPVIKRHEIKTMPAGEHTSKTKNPLEDIGPNYFIYAGAAFIGIALVIAITRGSQFFR
jgi:hypothetical protein